MGKKGKTFSFSLWKLFHFAFGSHKSFRSRQKIKLTRKVMISKLSKTCKRKIKNPYWSVTMEIPQVDLNEVIKNKKHLHYGKYCSLNYRFPAWRVRELLRDCCGTAVEFVWLWYAIYCLYIPVFLNSKVCQVVI